jgi:hypothetical protein
MQYEDEIPLQEELTADEPVSDQEAGPRRKQTEGEKERVADPGKYWRLLYNKYLLTTLVFIVWLVFFDGNNLISRYRVKRELRSMKHQKEYYMDEIAKNEVIRDQLANDLDKVEQYGREKYLMKRDNEDVFLIIEEVPNR